MIEQLELVERRAPAVTDNEVEALVELLRGRGWMTAADICSLAESVIGVRWPDRKVRALASGSGGRVISYPGSPGYKLTLECTPEEIGGAEILRHQAAEMTRRCVEINCVWHGRKGVRWWSAQQSVESSSGSTLKHPTQG
jgi:hypothetical protein